MKCVHCGGPNARKQVDPYEADVNNNPVEEWLHDKCADEIAEEI